MRLLHGEIPDLVLWAIVAGWAITQILTTGGALYLLRDGAKKRDEVVDHFDGQLKLLKEEIGAPEALEGKIDASRAEIQARIEAVKETLQGEVHGVQESLNSRLDELKIDDRISEIRDDVRTFHTDFAEFSKQLGKDLVSMKMGSIGAQGDAQKVLQTALVEHGQDFEADITMMEAVASENPEIIIGTAMQKVANWQPSKKFQEEHELIAAAAEMGKPFILQKLAEALGVGPAQLPGKRRKGGSIYG